MSAGQSSGNNIQLAVLCQAAPLLHPVAPWQPETSAPGERKQGVMTWFRIIYKIGINHGYKYNTLYYSILLFLMTSLYKI